MSRLCKAELSEVDAIKSILPEFIKITLSPSKFYVIGPTLRKVEVEEEKLSEKHKDIIMELI